MQPARLEVESKVQVCHDRLRRVLHCLSLCFGLLPDSNVEYDTSVILVPEYCGGISTVCEQISWDDVLDAEALNRNRYLLL